MVISTPNSSLRQKHEPKFCAVASTMDTPLLDNGNTPPSLSNGPLVVEDEGEENSGLISRLSGRADQDFSEDAVLEDEPQRHTESPARRAFFVIFSGALLLLHVGFVWGSYLTSSWSDVYVSVTTSWLPKVETCVRSINLGEVLDVFFQAKQYLTVILVALTGLVLPIFGMVIHSVRIVQQHQGTNQQQQVQWLEISMRFALFVVYILSILDLSMTFELQWTGTQISVYNRWRGGLVSFIGGTLASMVMVTLFRVRQGLLNNAVKVPPNSAFDMFRKHPPAENGDYALLDSDENREAPREGRIRQLCAWEFGLLALILLVPTVTLPLLRISYSGVAAKFMADTSKHLCLWQMPILLWKHGQEAGTQLFMLLVAVTASILHVLLAPLIALWLGLSLWWNGKNSSRRRLILYGLYPHVNSITFALAVVVMGKSLSSVGQVLLDNDAQGVCQKIDNLVGESCMDLSGQILGGSWFCLGQAVALEIFLLITLSSFQ